MMPRYIAVLVAALALPGCALQPAAPSPVDRVILLPGRNGGAGAVTVQQGGQSATLDEPYASARVSAGGALEVFPTDLAAVRAQFADALNALPAAPVSFVVYFLFGQDELTDESRKEFDPVLQAVAGRPAPEVTVIGHADQAGPERINDTLAMRRAERVKEMLVQRGVHADRIRAAGRGSREPAVSAPEGVAEARNRRVEISVR